MHGCMVVVQGMEDVDFSLDVFFGYENKTPSNDFLLVTFFYLSSFLVRKIDQLFIARYEKRT